MGIDSNELAWLPIRFSSTLHNQFYISTQSTQWRLTFVLPEL